jgi:predicted DNA-binding transcriptional regulator YafY
LNAELQSALLKLTASLAENEHRDQSDFRQYFLFDSTWWQQGGYHLPHLQAVQEAVWGKRRLRIVYKTHHSVAIEQVVSPYGLVAKAGRWYLVCAMKGSLRVHRVEKLVDAQVLNEVFERPAGFDLAQFWAGWCSEQETRLVNFTAHVRVAPHFIPFLPHYFGHQVEDQISQAGQPDEEGWLELELSFESFEAARDQILGFGRGVKVLAPRALQLSVCDYANQILDLYQAD